MPAPDAVGCLLRVLPLGLDVAMLGLLGVPTAVASGVGHAWRERCTLGSVLGVTGRHFPTCHEMLLLLVFVVFGNEGMLQVAGALREVWTAGTAGVQEPSCRRRSIA